MFRDLFGKLFFKFNCVVKRGFWYFWVVGRKNRICFFFEFSMDFRYIGYSEKIFL